MVWVDRHNPVLTRQIQLTDHRLAAALAESFEHFNVMLVAGQRALIASMASPVQPSVIINWTAFLSLHNAKPWRYYALSKGFDFFFRNDTEFPSTKLIIFIFFDLLLDLLPSKFEKWLIFNFLLEPRQILVVQFHLDFIFGERCLMDSLPVSSPEA